MAGTPGLCPETTGPHIPRLLVCCPQRWRSCMRQQLGLVPVPPVPGNMASLGKGQVPRGSRRRGGLQGQEGSCGSDQGRQDGRDGGRAGAYVSRGTKPGREPRPPPWASPGRSRGGQGWGLRPPQPLQKAPRQPPGSTWALSQVGGPLRPLRTCPASHWSDTCLLALLSFQAGLDGSSPGGPPLPATLSETKDSPRHAADAAKPTEGIRWRPPAQGWPPALTLSPPAPRHPGTSPPLAFTGVK